MYKVGDRVAVYLCQPSSASTIRSTGTITWIFEGWSCYPYKNDDEIVFQVEPDKKSDYIPSYVHPKQCRKLIKK